MAEPALTFGWLRSLAIEHCDRDLGEVADDTCLADVGLTEVDMLCLVAAIDDDFAVEFRADLLTVVDLVHITEVKATHARDEEATA